MFASKGHTIPMDQRMTKPFQSIKCDITSYQQVLAPYYDTKLPLILASDVSPYGLYVILSQRVRD